MWRGEPFLNNMHKQHFSAGRIDLQISAGRTELQINAGRAELQINAGRAELQISASSAEVSSVGICSIQLWKFAIVTSARHRLNCQLLLAH